MTEQNQELELIQQLTSDKRSLRIQAVVKLSRIGKTSEAMNALSKLAASPDREEAFFASQGAAKIAQRLGGDVMSVPQAQDALSSEIQAGSVTSRDFLYPLKENIPNLLQYIRSNTNSLSSEILPSVGVFLGKYGDKSDLPIICNYLKNNSSNMTLPFISAAEKIDSSVLPPLLPHLLASKEALVRSRAVMSLRKIDPTEAEKHFLKLLSSNDPEAKLAAIEISFLFPFDRVKGYIMALLNEESDMDVLKAAATMLASNPSQETALKLLDVLEAAPKEQKKNVTVIFNVVCASIASAKLLPPEKSTPEAMVQAWKEQRLMNFLNDLELQLSTTIGPKREAIIAWIEKNRSIPQVGTFIEKLALNPQTEDVYQKLSDQNLSETLILPSLDKLLPIKSNIVKAAEKTKPVPDKQNVANDTALKNQVAPSLEKKQEIPVAETQQPTETQQVIAESAAQITVTEPEQQEQQQSPNVTSEAKEVPEAEPQLEANSTEETSSEAEMDIDQQIKAWVRYYKKIDMNQFMEDKDNIEAAAENEDIPVAIRVEALNALLRLSPTTRIKSFGINALSSENTKLKTAGFKILERVSPETLKEQLADLLLSEDDNIRVRAVRFGLKIDQSNSIEALKNLIKSRVESVRANAVCCFAICPFELVYQTLIKQLKKETQPIIAKQITSIFVNNPSKVILSVLDQLDISENPSIELIISQAKNDLEEILGQVSSDSLPNVKLEDIDLSDKKDAIMKEVETAEKEKPYSVENVRKLSKREIQAQKEEEENKKQEKFLIISGVVLAIFVIAGTILFFTSNEGWNPQKYSKETREAERKTTSTSSKKSKIPTTFRMNRPCTVTGEVVNVVGVSLVINHNGRELMVKFKNNEASNHKIGDKVSVTCTPYKENPNGIILANGTKISKVDEPKKDNE